MKRVVIVICMVFCSTMPFQVLAEETLEQQFMDLMVKNAIVMFEQPQFKEQMSRFSELIKDENTYQYIIQRIDKFILTNELDEYEDQAEALKEFLTEARELYIESEEKTLEKYNQLKQQQQQQEKEKQLKANQVIEI